MRKTKTKRPEKANRTGRPINVWLPIPLHDAIGSFRDHQRVMPSMTEVVEVAVREFLVREGFWETAK